MSSRMQKFISAQKKYDRVVLLVDMDCFYCQVEEKLNPSFVGKPLAVVQYNSWKGGGIIAVNYAARAKGVTRHMRGDEAKKQCPDIELVRVPSIREKADISKYRDAGLDVANVLQRYTHLLERASVDEAYLDITDAVKKRIEEIDEGKYVLQPEDFQATYAVGYASIGDYIQKILATITDPNRFNNNDSNDKETTAVRKSDIRLLVGASIAAEIRSAVKRDTGYECSAGIAHNKILAKLVCGLNKPNKQTLIPLAQIEEFFNTLPVGKIKGLGGRFGEEICEKAGVRFLGELTKFSREELQRMFDEKNGSWLYDIARGIDLEIVTRRVYSKSIGSCKKFPGPSKITTLDKLEHWINELSNELSVRLEKDAIENKRRAKKMVVSYVQDIDGVEIPNSRSTPLVNCDKETIAKTSLEVIKTNTKQFLCEGSNTLSNPLKFLGINVGKFETSGNERGNLQEMFANQAMKQKLEKTNLENNDKLEDVHKLNVGDLNEYLEMDIGCSEDIKSNLSLGSNNSILEKFQENKTRNVSFFEKVELNQKESIKKFLESLKNTEAENGIKEKIPPDNKIEKITASSENSFFLNALKKGKLSGLATDLNGHKETYKLTNYEEDPNADNHSTGLQDGSNEQKNDNKIQIHLSKEETSMQKPKNVSLLNNADNKKVEKENNINNCTECHSDTKRKSTDKNHEQNSFKRNRSNIESTSPHSSYINEYAEYAVPELNQLQFVLCNICSQKILADDLSQQLHQDYHLAQQLSKEQRLEFQQQIKTKVDVNKKKASKNSVSNKPMADISKFLKKTEIAGESVQCSEDQNVSLVPAGNEKQELSVCVECGVSVPSNRMDEHMDYHIAKYLHRQINQLEVRTVVIPTNKSNSEKKNTKNTSRSDSSVNVAVKPITNFFKKTIQ